MKDKLLRFKERHKELWKEILLYAARNTGGDSQEAIFQLIEKGLENENKTQQ